MRAFVCVRVVGWGRVGVMDQRWTEWEAGGAGNDTSGGVHSVEEESGEKWTEREVGPHQYSSSVSPPPCASSFTHLLHVSPLCVSSSSSTCLLLYISPLPLCVRG